MCPSRSASPDPISCSKNARRDRSRRRADRRSNRWFLFRISELAGAADPDMRTYEVTGVFVPVAELTVLRGTTAEGHGARFLRTMRRGGLQVPANAIACEPDGQPFVWCLDPETMTVAKVPVTLGEEAGLDDRDFRLLQGGDELEFSGVREPGRE